MNDHSVAPESREEPMADAPTTPKQYFEEKIAKKLQDRPDISKAVNSVYGFNITGDNGGVWAVDPTKEPRAGPAGTSGAAKCTVTAAAGDVMNIGDRDSD